MKLPLLLYLLDFLMVIFTACRNPNIDKIVKHYSEEMLQGFEKICDQQKNRDTGIYLIDSLYNTFPYISIQDKYRYYEFRRKMIDLARYGYRSYDTAIGYTDSMIAIIEINRLEKPMRIEYGRAFNIRGEYYINLERYDYAVRDIVRCKQLNGEVADSCLMAENTKTLSTIAIRQSDYPLAANLMKEAILLASSCKKDEQQFRRMQRYLDDLGFIYASFRKYDSSIFYHHAAIRYIEQNKKLLGHDTLFAYIALDNVYGNMGVAYGFQKNITEAELYLKKAMLIEQDVLHDSSSLAQSQYWLGIFYMENKKIAEADVMAEKATLQLNNLDPAHRVGLLMLKADIAKEKKQYKDEAIYRAQFAKIVDSLNKAKIELLKKSPLMEYERLEKKYEIELLKIEGRNQRSKATAAISIGILVTILAITSVFLLWRIRIVMRKRSIIYSRLVKSEQELKETMRQKEIAERQLIEKELFSQEMRLQMEFHEAIIQQRRQISDDMHDELSSSLAALKYYVEDIKSRSAGTVAEKPLSDIRDEVSTVYQNARSYMHSLKTNNWATRFSLIGFLREIQQKFSEKGLMVVQLNLEEEGIKSSLSTRQHDQLYHIIREAISNVIKHASATKLLISICFNENTCNCVITDNGIGFNKEQVQYGIGIQSIKNRVQDMEGEVKIESAETGTRITVEFPLS